MILRPLAFAIAFGLAAVPAANAAALSCGPTATDGCCCPEAGAGPACSMGCSESSAATLLSALPSPPARYHVRASGASADAPPSAASPLIHEVSGPIWAAGAGLHDPPEALYLLHRSLRL